MSQSPVHESGLSEALAVCENPSLPLNVATEDLSSNRDAWKFDKECSLCGTSFGVLKMQHKYRCKFCYRGICAKCSKHRVLHPEFGTERRCCSACYEKFISTTMREEMQGRLSMSQERMSRIERKLTNVQDDRADAGATVLKLTSELTKLRLQQTRLDSELEKVTSKQRATFEKLLEQKRMMETMREERIGKVSEVRSRTEKRRQEIENLSNLVSNALRAIADNKTQLAQIQEEEITLMQMSAEVNKAKETVKTTKELKSALVSLEVRCRNIDTQNESAKLQLRSLEKELKSIDASRKQENSPVEMLTCSRGSSVSDIDIEKEKAQYRELLAENDELRRKREEIASNQLTFVIKTERSQSGPATFERREDARDPRACGCSLF